MIKTKINYYEYIRSDSWQQKRKQYYSSNMYKCLKGEGKWKCYCCEKNDVPLDLHHRTYKRLGNENIAIDLVPVCRKCHTKIHYYEKNKNYDIWSATKKVRKDVRSKKKKEEKKAKKLSVGK